MFKMLGSMLLCSTCTCIYLLFTVHKPVQLFTNMYMYVDGIHCT